MHVGPIYKFRTNPLHKIYEDLGLTGDAYLHLGLSGVEKKMEKFLNELKLDGNSKNILNAENGLTFCIQVGEEENFSTGSLFNPLRSELMEPTISLSETDLEDEDEFISHEIIAECDQNGTAENWLSTPKKFSQKDVTKAENFYDNHEFVKKNRRLWKSAPSVPLPSGDTFGSLKNMKVEKDVQLMQFSFKNRRKNTGKMRASRVQNKKASSVILNAKALYTRKNYSGLKVMINPKTSECVLKSNYTKAKVKESFNIEPWMTDTPKVLQRSKDCLYISHKDSRGNSLSNPVISKINAVTSPNKRNISHPTSNQPSIKLIKDEKGEWRENGIFNENSKSKIVYWEEGNIDEVTDFISLSDEVKRRYPKSMKLDMDPITSEFPEFINIPSYENVGSTRTGAASGVNALLSWEAVKERVEEIQEETMTKFTFDYKTPTFKEEPKPFKRIYFELDIKRRDVEVIIPNRGVPFIFLGICVYACHLGKKRSKNKEFVEEDVSKILKTKKIGCPAMFSVSRIARFPDFDVSGLSPNCENAVLKEVKDAWDFATSRVRYYIEYHVREPKASDHKGHEVQYLISNNRFKEPVDPRILDKVRELTRQGYSVAKLIHEKVDEFIREDLFKGESNPPLTRRRYNPSRRDIRYAITKAKEELRREGKNMVQLECSALANEISESVKNITQEDYLNQLKYYLTLLFKTVKSQEPLESLFLLGNIDASSISPSVPTTPKRGPKRKKSEDLPDGGAIVEAGKEYLLETDPLVDQLQDQVIEQFYINVPEANENAFNAQIYAQEFVDMNSGLVDSLQPAVDDTVTEVYYYYPDGTCELATAEAMANVQT